jgi:SPP1 gp7 family putative phage head morphogenesis protein
MLKTKEIIVTVLDAADWLEARHIQLPADVALKRRDRREPQRRQKEEADLALRTLLGRVFQKQERKIRTWLALQFPARKAAINIPDEFLEWDEADEAKLLRLLREAMQAGIALFGADTNIGFDSSLTNIEAAQAASRYGYRLIKDLNATGLEALRTAITQFVETPGMTLGDVAAMLPYSAERAQLIAVTETTRAYAQGQQMAGEQMRKDFPDVRVVQRWYTNNDDRVCEICGPLDGTEADLGETFEGIEAPPAHPNCRCWIQTSTRLRK